MSADASHDPLDSRPLAVIPARWASSRFPGKPLALLGGKPMVQHVFERAVQSGAFSRVLVATDDPRIMEVVQGFGGDAQLTSPDCATGTDRVAEVARLHEEVQVLVNVQGDEPLISPDALRELASAFDDPSVQMATLVRALREDERQNPNVVKAVIALSGDALYFSRADVPFVRDPATPDPSNPASPLVERWAHVGLYGYRRETLLKLARLPSSPLEELEKLEQLRALEHGIRIRCRRTLFESLGVDTPADLARAEQRLCGQASA